jgi:hypothetical protein
MRDGALIDLLNVKIRSYLVSKTSPRFASPASELGVRVPL